MYLDVVTVLPYPLGWLLRVPAEGPRGGGDPHGPTFLTVLSGLSTRLYVTVYHPRPQCNVPSDEALEDSDLVEFLGRSRLQWSDSVSWGVGPRSRDRRGCRGGPPMPHRNFLWVRSEEGQAGEGPRAWPSSTQSVGSAVCGPDVSSVPPPHTAPPLHQGRDRNEKGSTHYRSSSEGPTHSHRTIYSSHRHV